MANGNMKFEISDGNYIECASLLMWHNQLYSHWTLRVKLADPTPAAFELVTWYTPESSLTVSMMAMSLADTVTLLSLMVWLFLVHMKLSGGGLAAN